ncbi:unnamed protein product [Chrysoparadoxa australica]
MKQPLLVALATHVLVTAAFAPLTAGFTNSAVGSRLSQQQSLINSHHQRLGTVFAAGGDGDELENKDSLAGKEDALAVATEVTGGASAPAKKGFRASMADLIPTPTERKKLIPLGLMFFCILFNYTILRDTKDVLVVTAPASGAEIIPFLKTYVNLPAAVLFNILYFKMNNMMSPAKVFYCIMGPFLAFFASFGAFIYPARASLHPNAASDWLLSVLPGAFAPLIAIFRNWTYAVFYTMAELWGSVVVSVLFWGTANSICTRKEAKKYYPLFGLGANVALIFSGQYVKFVSQLRAQMGAGVDKWGVSLQLLTGAVVTFGMVIVALYTHLVKNVMSDPELVGKEAAGKSEAKAATKMDLGESAKYLASSPYIRNLALLVIAYGMSINIVEVTWKGKLKAAFPDPNDYSSFMGNFSSATGTVTLIMMLLGRVIFTKFGWGFAAMITPTVLAATGAAFFSLILFNDTFAPLMSKAGTTPLMAAVLVGAAQNILSKASKYSLFDPCKEMAYIPLDAEQKTKGKAAIDVIGNPLGKSGGSFIQQILIVSLGSLAASTPYLAGILFAIIGMWLNAARNLAKMVKEQDVNVTEAI